LAGEKPDGVQFAQNDAVEILSGPDTGERGAIILLLALEPEPCYFVELGSGRGDRNIDQSALRPIENQQPHV
jgi:hypothetical protein